MVHCPIFPTNCEFETVISTGTTRSILRQTETLDRALELFAQYMDEISRFLRTTRVIAPKPVFPVKLLA